ncbi:28S ribosomal protein S5, mitochondrial [Thelohanellus kitauei]|uniref:28S ribosomal protein S5, mitochondrial n=1 Tax=Thelohanellus kitauei TaxID=669202 RepID=A0A0C2MZZ7_THEKT|nr:28S ribosomal protein S5, mitochondrial [Thelohanellus kitauei]
MGIGDAVEKNDAIILARDNAVKNLHKVPLQSNHSLIHRVKTKMNRLHISFDPRPDGYGLRCHRIIKSMCKVIGIRNLHARLLGNSRKTISIVQATIQAFATQETNEELAERTGCYVVQMKPEYFNLPEIVAIPSKENILRAKDRRNETFDYDFTRQLDPYQGLHRPKRVVLHDRTTKRWKGGVRRMRYIIKEVIRGRRY